MKLAVEVVINVGVQPLFWVGGGGWVDCGLISTQVEAAFEVWLEIVLKIDFHGWVAGGGWLEQSGIRLSQLPT